MGNDSEDEDKTSQTARSQIPGVTVGVAPSFKSAERAEKRKEFNMKMEQKQEALEAETRENIIRKMVTYCYIGQFWLDMTSNESILVRLDFKRVTGQMPNFVKYMSKDLTGNSG
ncbi:hypothetical protein Hanom_Chr14g01284621 [Helianthus anomalus]